MRLKLYSQFCNNFLLIYALRPTFLSILRDLRNQRQQKKEISSSRCEADEGESTTSAVPLPAGMRRALTVATCYTASAHTAYADDGGKGSVLKIDRRAHATENNHHLAKP